MLLSCSANFYTLTGIRSVVDSDELSALVPIRDSNAAAEIDLRPYADEQAESSNGGKEESSNAAVLMAGPRDNVAEVDKDIGTDKTKESEEASPTREESAMNSATPAEDGRLYVDEVDDRPYADEVDERPYADDDDEEDKESDQNEPKPDADSNVAAIDERPYTDDNEANENSGDDDDGRQQQQVANDQNPQSSPMRAAQSTNTRERRGGRHCSPKRRKPRRRPHARTAVPHHRRATATKSTISGLTSTRWTNGPTPTKVTTAMSPLVLRRRYEAPAAVCVADTR